MHAAWLPVLQQTSQKVDVSKVFDLTGWSAIPAGRKRDVDIQTSGTRGKYVKKSNAINIRFVKRMHSTWIGVTEQGTDYDVHW